MQFSVAATTSSGGPWLAIGPLSGTTSANLTAAVNPANLAPGTYNGTIAVTSQGVVNSPVSIPVSLNITRSPLLQLSPAGLSFAAQTGSSAVPAQTISVMTSTGAALPLTAVAATITGGDWLHAGVPSANGTFTVNVTPATLGPGAYVGSVTITAVGAGNSPVTIPVRLVVSDTACCSRFRPPCVSLSLALRSPWISAPPTARLSALTLSPFRLAAGCR